MTALHDHAPYALLASSEAPDVGEAGRTRAALVEQARASRSSMRAVVVGLFGALRAAGCLRAAVLGRVDGGGWEILASSEAGWDEVSAEEGAVAEEAVRRGAWEVTARGRGAGWRASFDAEAGTVTLSLWPAPSPRPPARAGDRP